MLQNIYTLNQPLKTLSTAKASGPNGLSNHILHELSKELSIPYCSLFNQSLHVGIVPSSYKEANICPVTEEGNLTDATNYSPISLLNSEDKALERLVLISLFNYLNVNNLLSSLQFGFLPGDSTVNQLACLYNTCPVFFQAKKSGLFSVTSAKHSIVCGMSLLHFKQLVSQETPTLGFQIISLIENNELFYLILFLIGLTFVLEFHGDQY